MSEELDLFGLKGKTIVVTGAAQGIGRAVTEQIINLGGQVVAVDLQQEPLMALRDALGEKITTYEGDVSDPGFAQHVVEDANHQFAPIDGLVNNAGIVRAAMIDKMSAHQWNEVISVNLTGPFNFLQAVGRVMKARSKEQDDFAGSIVNISSDAGRRGTTGQINYGAAKSGVLGLTMSAAREWSRYNIRTNSLCFGVVETPMTETIRGEKFADTYKAMIPMGRWASAQEVGRPVCFLLSDAASYITGQHLSVNGGFHIGM